MGKVAEGYFLVGKWKEKEGRMRIQGGEAKKLGHEKGREKEMFYIIQNLKKKIEEKGGQKGPDQKKKKNSWGRRGGNC